MTNLCLGSVFATCAFSPQFGAMTVKADDAVSPDARYASFQEYRGNDLGLTLSGHEAKFRLWSPEADAVKLRLYKNARGGDAIRTIDMLRSPPPRLACSIPSRFFTMADGCRKLPASGPKLWGSTANARQ